MQRKQRIDMLSRILNNNNENISYPLAEANTVYPDGLISDMAIMSDCTDICITSATVTDSSIHVLLAGEGKRLWHAHSVKSSHNVLSILDTDTREVVGWIAFGALANVNAVYSQKVPICKSCIMPMQSRVSQDTMTINGSVYRYPDKLDIIITGDLDVRYDKHESRYIVDIREGTDTSMYATPIDENSGGIQSINGIPASAGEGDTSTLTIVFPRVAYGDIDNSSSTDDTGSSSSTSSIPMHDVFTVTAVNHMTHRTNYMTITIKNIVYDSEKKNSKLYAPFTCPSSDILLDKVYKSAEDDVELPLDIYLDGYAPGLGYVTYSDSSTDPEGTTSV